MKKRELLKYAFVGLLVNIEGDKKRLAYIKDERLKALTKYNIKQMQKKANSILYTLRKYEERKRK